MSAQIRNQVLRAQNRRALIDSRAGPDGPSRSLRRLLKEQRGVGVALPGANVHVHPAPVRVCRPIGPPFPATVRRLYALSHAQLSTLAILFNNDFGITALDSLEQRRVRFQHFIVGL